jgi:tetratricopeptide (TPR) repeat protein
MVRRIIGEDRAGADPAAIRELAHLCDLLPFALRIAGARLAAKPHWTVGFLVARLSDECRRLDELSQGSSQVRAGFSFSYRALSGDTARLYRLLGLLDVPDFSAWIGAALLDTDPLTAERLTEELVDAQLLDVVGLDATGRPRYRFQNLMRLFARERARDEEPPEEAHAAQVRAFRACLSLAEQAYQGAYGGDFGIVHGSEPRYVLPEDLSRDLLTLPLEWLETEHRTLAAVVEQAAGMGLDELVWDLTTSLVVLFETRDHPDYPDAWRHCATRALEVTRAAGNARGQAAMLHTLGTLDLRGRRLLVAATSFHAALRLYEQAGEKHGRALVLRSLAKIDTMRGELELAMARSVEALEVFRSVGDLSSEARLLSDMTQIELDRSRTDAARSLGEQSVRVAEAIGAGGSRSVALGTHRLARVHLAEGRWDQAEKALLRMLRLVRAQSDMRGLAHGLLGLGEARIGAGSYGRARSPLLHALEIAALLGSPMLEGKIKLALAESDRHRGQAERARDYLTDARRDFVRIGADGWAERVDRVLAEIDGDADGNADGNADAGPKRRCRKRFASAVTPP